jgi:hypothetical protein
VRKPLDGVGNQLGHEEDDRVARLPLQAQGSEGRQGRDGDAGVAVDVGHDRLDPGPPGLVGDAHDDIEPVPAGHGADDILHGEGALLVDREPVLDGGDPPVPVVHTSRCSSPARSAAMSRASW